MNAKSPVNLNLHSDNSSVLPEFNELNNTSPFTVLQDLLIKLGKEEFRQLIYASLTGVQILVRGPKRDTLETLYGLSSLVPRACRRVKTGALEYMDPNTCNFLGAFLISYQCVFNFK